MATTFLEPGGDADFGIILWPAKGGGTAPTAVSDFVHGAHLRSIKFAPGAFSYLVGSGFVTDAGGRVSLWIYLNALPTTTTAGLFQLEQTGDGSGVVQVSITTGGVLQLRTGNATETNIGTTGSTLSTATWYRLTLAWTITSTTVNTIKLFKNGTIDITVTNATLLFATSADFQIGNGDANAGLDFRYSDLYIDNSTALTDPGNIWVTAKRPVANGTSVQFTTQVGAGGSGVGTGHSPQVNERPASATNGWSLSSAAKVTEEYTIEAKTAGDIDISTATIVDFMGWIRALIASTANTPVDHIIVANVATVKTMTTAAATYRAIAGSTTYPAGNTDIGMDGQYTTTAHLMTLQEAGIVVAYIPVSGTVFTQALTGGLSFVGAQAKLTSIPQAATLSFSGNIAKRASRTLTGALSFVGSIRKFTTKSSFTGALSFVGAFIASHTFIKIFTASLGFTATDWALSFNGGSDIATVNDDPALRLTNNFTLAGWVYQAIGGTTQRIFAKEGSYGFGVDSSSNLLMTTFGILDYTSTSLSHLGLATWTPVAMVMDSSNNVSFYINGVLTETVTGSSPANTNTNNLTFGRTSNGEFWSGRLDELVIVNRALTAAEIQGLAAYRMPTSNLIGHWPMNEGNGTTTADTSGSGFTATLASPTWVEGRTNAAFSKRTNKALAARLSFVGAFPRVITRTFTAALSFSGAIAKRTARIFTGGLSFVGALLKRAGKALTAALSFSGAINRLVQRTFTGALSFAGSVNKLTKRAFTGAVSFIGALTNGATTIYTITFTAALRFSGTINRRTAKGFTASLHFLGSLLGFLPFAYTTIRGTIIGSNKSGIIISTDTNTELDGADNMKPVDAARNTGIISSNTTNATLSGSDQESNLS